MGIVWLVLLGGVALVGSALWYANTHATPVVQPVGVEDKEWSPDVYGMTLTSFSFKGSDGVELPACIATSSPEGQLTARQSRVLDHGKQLGFETDGSAKKMLVVLSTTWDRGIDHSLSMAEALVPYGITCVLWDARGKDNEREYCQYGLLEAGDVSRLLDAVEARIGKRELVAAVGQGFGAAVLLRATVGEPRIRNLVSIDAFPILRHALLKDLGEEMSDWRKQLEVRLINWGMERKAGYTSADVVCVDDADKLTVPAMVLSTGQHFYAGFDEALTIYKVLKDGDKELYDLANESDAQDARERNYKERIVDKRGRTKEFDWNVKLYRNEEQLQAHIANWLLTRTHLLMPVALPNTPSKKK